MRPYAAFVLAVLLAASPAFSRSSRSSSGRSSSTRSSSSRSSGAGSTRGYSSRRSGSPGTRSTTSTARKSGHVGSYTRKDGTVVRSYNRAPAGTATHAAAPRAAAPRTSTRPLAANGPSKMGAKSATPRAAASNAGIRKSTVACATCSRDSKGRIARSEAAKHDFQKSHPCPATGRASGPCPGYVVDHVVALKRGGADTPNNMQWQTTVAAKAKDRIE